MKIAFIDLSAIDFTPLTPGQQPLGGMQSGLCYLSRELAQRGHEVLLFNASRQEGAYDGVQLLNFQRHFPAGRHDCDVYISISCDAQALRPFTRGRPLILYTGHNDREKSMQVLAHAEERDAWDHFVFKSNWQADAFRAAYAIDPSQISIITNAVAPAFESLAERRSFWFTENRPPVLYFSSTPFRGLDILAQAFPAIAQAVPGTTAKIYSSMAPYHAKGEGRDHSQLYQACRDAGMDYVGSLSQPDLAAAVAAADVLAFPSTYAETSCITLMEAMAGSAMIVSRNLGAIAETSAGFAHIMPENAALKGSALAGAFAQYTIAALQQVRARPEAELARLRLERHYCRANYSWPRKAAEWESLLREITAPPQPKPAAASHGAPAVYNYVQTIEGRKIHVDPRDGRARRLMALGGSLNPETAVLWRAAVRACPWTMIVDAGANYGEMLLEPAVAACPRVLAVEPNPRLLPYLRKTVAGASNIEVVEAALAERSGEQAFSENRGWSGMSKLGDGPRAFTVRTTTVDDLVLGDHPADDLRLLLKIDVEGAEMKVLAGAARSIARAMLFNALVEVSNLGPEQLAEIGSQFNVFALDMRGYRITPLESFQRFRQTRAFWQQDVLISRKGGAV